MSLGEAFANWRCECGRAASIEHPFGGYCSGKEIIKTITAERDALKLRLSEMKLENLRLREEASKGYYTPDKEVAYEKRYAELYQLAHRMAEDAIAFTSDIYNREKADKLAASVTAFRAANTVEGEGEGR